MSQSPWLQPQNQESLRMTVELGWLLSQSSMGGSSRSEAPREGSPTFQSPQSYQKALSLTPAVLGSFVLPHRLTNRVPVSKENTLENLCRSFWHFYPSVLASIFSWWLIRGERVAEESIKISTFVLCSGCLSSSPYRHGEWEGVLRHQLGFIIIIIAIITFALRSYRWHWRCRGIVCF